MSQCYLSTIVSNSYTEIAIFGKVLLSCRSKVWARLKTDYFQILIFVSSFIAVTFKNSIAYSVSHKAIKWGCCFLTDNVLQQVKKYIKPLHSATVLKSALPNSHLMLLQFCCWFWLNFSVFWQITPLCCSSYLLNGSLFRRHQDITFIWKETDNEQSQKYLDVQLNANGNYLKSIFSLT